MAELKTEEMIINMGPQHPSTHGVLRLLVTTDGEIVNKVDPVIGYLHRCFEKHAENVAYDMVLPYTDRMDYLASMNMNFGFAIAIERLLGIEISERADYLRVIMGELQRIASHLVAFGTFGLDAGAFTPFLFAFRDRERILDIFETTCGARLLYNYIWVGGVSYDIDDKIIKMIREFCDYFEPKIKEYNDLLSYNQIFIKRTANVGILPADVAINYGCTGPMLRGSGINWDLRKSDPYSIYDRFDFNVCVGTGEMGTVGDCWDRYMVRIHEMEESLKIVRQALDGLPEGNVQEKIPKNIKPKANEIYFRTESPRGEIGYYVIADGSKQPYRVKVRSPAFCNLSVLDTISRGYMLADLVVILGSVDIVLGEVDR